MTIAQALITSAFRENNLIPIGTSPTTAELTEALERLNRYVQGVYGYELGEPLKDWAYPAPQRTALVAANYPQAPFPLDAGGGVFGNPYSTALSANVTPYPPKNSRIVWGGVTGTVWFPEQPDPGSRMALVQGSGAGDSGAPGQVLTIDGNGRTIAGTNTVTFTDPATATNWLYREDLGNWVPVVDMALSDQCPFPTDIDDLWITALSIRMAPRFGKPTPKETGAAFTAALKRVKARYRQSGVTTYGSQDFPRSMQSYISGRWFY
jgi:hypothetical protein